MSPHPVAEKQEPDLVGKILESGNQQNLISSVVTTAPSGMTSTRRPSTTMYGRSTRQMKCKNVFWDMGMLCRLPGIENLSPKVCLRLYGSLGQPSSFVSGF